MKAIMEIHNMWFYELKLKQGKFLSVTLQQGEERPCLFMV